MEPRTRRAKNNSISKKSGAVPHQEKTHYENKSITDSAKKVGDNPSSNSIKKADKQVHKSIEKLKSLRIVPIDEDNMQLRYRIFYGTPENRGHEVKIVPIDENKTDTENNNNQVKRTSAVDSLKSTQKCIAAKPGRRKRGDAAKHKLLLRYRDMSKYLPEAAPITEEKPEPPKKKPEFPCHILFEVPDPDEPFDP